MTDVNRTESEWMKHRGIGTKVLKSLWESGRVIASYPISDSVVFSSLSQKSRNVLHNEGINCKSEAISAIKNSTLVPGITRQLGPKTFMEISQWALAP